MFSFNCCLKLCCSGILTLCLYSASHSEVALENIGLQKEQKYNTFACHTCNEMQLCVLGIHIRKLAARKEMVAQPAETSL
jgi:hypothetical protein